ncbi:hypothetical protein CKM354_000744200 [Cercospora kikuchii]|uniref:Extracellular serine-rich protein n=1 Tax=Cercospora kikuchii TaxID=84275 RepID=A0A9P3FEB8_9PEZI|nr:uncharacterized protein CKM354_000744200 [Cercospora kikuchii]GIZ44238.1 hypothetical protein CKM354_000744200 [Cercospora kikuchii]
MAFRNILTFLLADTALVYAQNGATGPNNGTGDRIFMEDEITVHLVTVGKVSHEFVPNLVVASPGDKIMFEFSSGNHSVIQSLYEWPCVASGAVDGRTGFASPPQAEATNELPTYWNLTINNTDPVFYYCGAPGSCVTWGMLGVINPTRDTNLTAQIEMAKEAQYVLYPDATLPASASASLSAVAASVLAESNPEPTATSSASPTASTSAAAPNDSRPALSTGVIVGIAIASVAIVAIIGALIFYFGRNRGQMKALRESMHRTQGENAAHRQSHAPHEMTVDGITYVPAHEHRVMSMKPGGFLPPYGAESRSKSPETVSSTPVVGTYQPYSPPGLNARNSNLASEHSDFYAPVPRHELHAQPNVPQNEESDVNRGSRYL